MTVIPIYFGQEGDTLLTEGRDNSLELSLATAGLQSYFQALNNANGGIMIEFSVMGATSIKPWNSVQFDSRAPERYRDKQFRITAISYDLVNDIANIKAYQISSITTSVIADELIDTPIDFRFGAGLLPDRLSKAVGSNISRRFIDTTDFIFRTSQALSGTVTRVYFDRDADATGLRILKGWNVLLIDPISGSRQYFTVSKSSSPTENFFDVEPVELGRTYAGGSYLYVSQAQILSGLINGAYQQQLFAQSQAMGVLTASVSDDDLTTELQVVLYQNVVKGQDFTIQSSETGEIYTLTVGEDALASQTVLNIADEGGAGSRFEAPAGAFLIADGRFNRASINVDPGRVQIGVEAEREANGIGVTSAQIEAGAVTSIPVTNAQTLTLRDGDHLIVTDRTGAFVDLTVTGEQSVTSGTTVINASGTATADIGAGAQVAQPAWNQTGEINVQAGRIDQVVTEVNGLDTSLAGLTLEVGELEQDVGDLQTDVGVIGARTVLFTDVNGNIASIELISGTTGSAIGIKADQVLVDAGQTVFINSLKSEGFVTDDDLPTTFGNITIRSATAPTTRPDTTALVAGDRWLKSDAGELPHVWTGSVWAQEYVIIDGGSVSVGTILSANYNFVSGDFATAGSSFDLSQGNIISSQFSIINGNAKFKGALEAASGTFAGSLDAVSGTFTGALSGGTIEIGTGNNVFKADANGIYLGNTTFASAPFRVTPAGVLTATGASITGAITADSLALNGAMSLGASGSINLNGNFLVDSSGFMSANGANIAGTITATAGTVGGISIANNQINSANNAFIVTDAGALTATNATITGAITATSGSFTGTVSTDNITATGGTVGGFTLDSTSLIAGTGATRISLHTTNGIHLGNNTFASAPFRVTPAGDLTANNATVTGTFTIEGGEFNAVIPVNDLGGIKSNNYVAGTSGWQIDGDGDAEFNNVTVRGNLDGVTGSLGALNVDGVLTIGATGSLDWSGGLIDTAGIKLTYGGYNSTPGSALRYLDGSTEKVVIHAVDAEGSPSIQAQINDNGGVFVFNIGSGLDLSDRPRVVRQEILSPSFRGTYKSADGTAGLTETIVFNDSVTNETNTVTIKNGLITAWTQIV
jgi:hypothetical protein